MSENYYKLNYSAAVIRRLIDEGMVGLPPSGRGAVLKKAYEVINGDRQDTYGHPEDSFQIIADYWNTYLGISTIKPHDVAIMMSLFKIARMQGQKHHEDNFIDCAGYVGIACDLKDRYEAKK